MRNTPASGPLCLLLPIMHVEHWQEELDERGHPYVYVFITPDWRFRLSSEQFERYQYQPDTSNKSPISNQKTVEQRLDEISAQLRSKDEPWSDGLENMRTAGNRTDVERESASIAAEAIGDRAELRRSMTEIVPIIGKDEKMLDEQMERLQSTIHGLDLSAASDGGLSKHVKIGDEAGPDGQHLTNQQWTDACAFILAPLPSDAVSGTDKHRRLMGAKQIMFNRISGPPLSVLKDYMALTPKPLRIRITLTKIKQLGANSQFIPGSWTSYIEGDNYHDQMMVSMFGSFVGGIKDHRGASMNIDKDAADRLGKARTGEAQTDMGLVTTAWDEILGAAGFKT
jgi:hypothetical protein